MSEYSGQAARQPYFEQGEDTRLFYIDRWFDMVCVSDSVEHDEFEAFGKFVKLNSSFGHLVENKEYLSKVAEMEPQAQKMEMINEAISAIVRSSVNSVDEKVGILGEFSASMFNAPRPLNGKRMVMRHVNRYHSLALSADSFRNGFNKVYKHADELQWRTRTEIPRLKSRGQILREHFEFMTGETAPRYIPAFMAIDAAMELEENAKKSSELNQKALDLARRRNVQKITRIMRKDPDAIADAFAKAYLSDDGFDHLGYSPFEDK